MANYVAVNRLQMASMLPRDVAVNTFHFTGPGEDAEDDALSISAKVITFFNSTPPPAANPTAYWLSPYLSRGAAASSVAVYDIGQPKPRVPIGTFFYQLGAAANTTSLPLEVSVVNSVSGAPQSGVPAARRRGRQFIGPLTTAAVDAGSASVPPSIHGDMRTTLIRASERMAEDESADTLWCVWSRVNQSMVRITRGWVDDDPDTQRRRGLRTTNRTTWTTIV